jgi:hypothetical protein
MRPASVPCLLRVGLLAGLAGACYAYHPAAAAPELASRVSVVLSDFGRLEASRQIGPRADRVEGALVAVTDTGYLLAVSGVKPLNAEWVRWTGETVSVRRDHVALLYERRLSKVRTAVFIGGAVAALVATVVRFDLFGIGNDPIDTVPGSGGNPGDQ